MFNYLNKLFKPHPLFEVEKKCKYRFRNKKYLEQAFSHRSISSQPRENYERLEFLGDAVIDIVISRELMREFPEGDEGILTQKRSALVQKAFLASMGKMLDLIDFIKIERTVDLDQEKIANKQSANLYEALIGAIYLDQGFTIVEKFIIKFWKNHMNMNMTDQVDAKTKLQEYSLKKYKVLPKYKLFSNTGPHHKPTFKIGVSLQNTKTFYAIGYSKKDAEQKAAKLFLKQIGL